MRKNIKWIILSFQLLDVDPQDQGEEDGAVVDLDSQRKGKCAVIKTSTRQVWNLLTIIHTFTLKEDYIKILLKINLYGSEWEML